MTKPKTFLVEASRRVESLTEETGSGKQLYIEGIFAQAEVVNGNGRIYKQKVMESAVDAYNTNYVKQNRALGELNHPDYPFPDPANAAIRITELDMNGSDVVGKALVLNTPRGQIIKGLLDGGYKLGVSTRGLGSLEESGDINYVQEDFMLTAVDAVDNPSAPDAFVTGVMESVQWELNESGRWVPFKKTKQKEKIDENELFDRLVSYFKSLKR